MNGWIRVPYAREALPNAPKPEVRTALMKEQTGTRFAFARFKTRTGSIQVSLRGRRECSRHVTPVTKIRKDRIEVEARRGNQKIGYAIFYRHGFEVSERLIDPERWSAYQIDVEQAFRRLGAASSIYGMVKSCGFEVLPSSAMLGAGSALWEKLQPGFSPTLPPEKLPACTDQSLIERCSEEFEPWFGLESRLAASTTLEEIAALSPQAARFVSACDAIPNWPSREIEAVRLLRDTTSISHRDQSLQSILGSAGFSKRTIWSHIIQSRLGRPSTLSALLAARSDAVRELNELDNQALSGFHDFKQEYQRWASLQSTCSASGISRTIRSRPHREWIR